MLKEQYEPERKPRDPMVNLQVYESLKQQQPQKQHGYRWRVGYTMYLPGGKGYDFCRTNKSCALMMWVTSQEVSNPNVYYAT